MSFQACNQKPTNPYTISFKFAVDQIAQPIVAAIDAGFRLPGPGTVTGCTRALSVVMVTDG
jgi:hypothetical protein